MEFDKKYGHFSVTKKLNHTIKYVFTFLFSKNTHLFRLGSSFLLQNAGSTCTKEVRYLFIFFLSLSRFYQMCSAQDFLQKGIPKYDPEFFVSKKEYLWIIKGREFANKNSYKKAIELFSRATQANPKSTAYYWIGLAHERIASQMIRDRRESKKDLIKPISDASRILNESEIKNHYEQAVLSYQKASEIFPAVDYIYYQTGKTSLEYLNDPEKAERFLTQAVELNPKEMVYRAALGSFFLASKRFAEARKESETAATDSRVVVQSEAHALMGRIELEQKNFSKAAEELSLSLSLNPGNFVSHYDLAKAYEGTQRYEQAVESHKNFLRLFEPSTLREVSLHEESDKDLERLERLRGGKIKR